MRADSGAGECEAVLRRMNTGKTPSLTFDPATPDDLPAIQALLAAAALPIDDVDATLVDSLQVARDDDRHLRGVVGLQRVAGGALLRSLAVASHARGQGVGARLLAAAEAQAWATGVRTLYLLTTSAAPFFASRGYIILARDTAPDGIRATAQFTGLCPASSVFMAKTLTSATE